MKQKTIIQGILLGLIVLGSTFLFACIIQDTQTVSTRLNLTISTIEIDDQSFIFSISAADDYTDTTLSVFPYTSASFTQDGTQVTLDIDWEVDTESDIFSDPVTTSENQDVSLDELNTKIEITKSDGAYIDAIFVDLSADKEHTIIIEISENSGRYALDTTYSTTD